MSGAHPGILLNPHAYSAGELDGGSRSLMEATIAYFESLGKDRITSEDNAGAWSADFCRFLGESKAFATLMTPAAYGEPLFSPDGQWLAHLILDRDSVIQLVRATNGEAGPTLHGHAGPASFADSMVGSVAAAAAATVIAASAVVSASAASAAAASPTATAFRGESFNRASAAASPVALFTPEGRTMTASLLKITCSSRPCRRIALSTATS